MGLIKAIAVYLWRRVRGIGHTHRYRTDAGLDTPFCVVCGKYR